MEDRVTLIAAWVREIGSTAELWFASDSRLTGGRTWDACPKLIPFDRGDAAIAFAGDTHDAYPLLTQLVFSLKYHQKLLTRAHDLTDTVSSVVAVLNSMWKAVSHPPIGESTQYPDCRFLFGGYSWRHQSFRLWRIGHKKHGEAFEAQSVINTSKSGTRHVFLGDPEAVSDANKRLFHRKHRVAKLDRQPVEVLRDIIRSKKHPGVGGPPQIVKVYRHLNARPYAVYWPDRDSNRVTIFGRTLHDHERSQLLAFDPDTMTTFKLWDYILPEEVGDNEPGYDTDKTRGQE